MKKKTSALKRQKEMERRERETRKQEKKERRKEERESSRRKDTEKEKGEKEKVERNSIGLISALGDLITDQTFLANYLTQAMNRQQSLVLFLSISQETYSLEDLNRMPLCKLEELYHLMTFDDVSQPTA